MLETVEKPSIAKDAAKGEARGKQRVAWHGIPWDIAGRIGLLFIALCVIKLLMLVEFRKYLYETHWRVSQTPIGWKNLVEFHCFCVLLGLNLWQFGEACNKSGGRVAVRAANLCVLVLASFFIFLTFHAGDTNYLEPVLDGALNWWDLKAYLSMDFFFQVPFLAFCLFIYALIYYGLARMGREHQVLRLTAVCAFLYTAFFLRSLAANGDALLVANCLGVISFWLKRGASRPLNWFCLIQPLIGIVVLMLLFRDEGESIRQLNPACAIIMGWCVVLFTGFWAVAWRRKFYAAWTWTLPFSFGSFLLMTNINYPLALNYQNLFLMGLTFPRYFTGEFWLAIVLLGAAKLYRHWLPKASMLWLDVMIVVLITLALADLRLTEVMGIRLDWQAIAFGANIEMVWKEARAYLGGIGIGLIICIALYAILTGLWRRGPNDRNLYFGPNRTYLFVTFLMLGLAGDWIEPADKAQGESAVVLAMTSPVFEWAETPPMDRREFTDAVKRLGMGQMLIRPEAPARPRRKLNVLLILQESSYNKYLSLFDGTVDTQPILAQYKDRMEIFPNFFSDFAASINARFAVFTGVYPVRDYEAFTQHRIYVRSLFGIMSHAGYHCSLYYSSFSDYTGFRDFLNGRHIEELYDMDNMPGANSEPLLMWGLREEVTASAIRAKITQYATNHETFFLTYVPVAPHNPFDGIPSKFRLHPKIHMDDYTPSYLNELTYMDWCIGSILDQLKTCGLLDNTLVLITDDHGEMLGGNGKPIGHGWAATPELTNVPLIIMDPDNPGYHVNYTIGSQIDVLPTVVDLLGLSEPTNKIYQGCSLYSPEAQVSRKIYLNSFQQYGILEGDRYLLGSRETQKGPNSKSTTKLYSISNDGSQTHFEELDPTDGESASIDEFDKFQENFLRNYQIYCKMFRN